MNKEPTRTIYACLGQDFWTKRHCSLCQKFFTNGDYAQQNYQLFFKEIGAIGATNSLNYAALERVLVKLSHQHCPLSCGFDYQPQIICPTRK